MTKQNVFPTKNIRKLSCTFAAGNKPDQIIVSDTYKVSEKEQEYLRNLIPLQR
jgi:hypothetical protein